jgi:hypothetical protein
MIKQTSVMLFVATVLIASSVVAQTKDTMASAKSAKADAYQNFRLASGDAVKTMAADKQKAVSLLDKSAEGWKAEFQPSASAAIAQRVEKAFALMKEAVNHGSVVAIQVNRQVVDKSMLDQIIPEFESALKAKKTDAAMAWFQVYVLKFELEKKAAEVVPPVKAALAAPNAQNNRIAGLALRKHIAAASIDEVSEAPGEIEKKDSDRAQAVTSEGRTYFLGIQDDFNKRAGKAEGDRMLAAFDEVTAAAKAADAGRAKKGFEQIKEALTKYQGMLTKAVNEK